MIKGRKIIQLIYAQPPRTQSEAIYAMLYALYALCDDGSVWWMNQNDNQENWQRLTDIPKD